MKGRKNRAFITKCRCVCFTSLLLTVMLFSMFPPAANAQSSGGAGGQPAHLAYGKVLRVSIICRDVETTTKLWAEILSLPAPEISTYEPGSSSFMDFHSATPNAKFKRAILQLENTQLEFLQPVGNAVSPEAEFAKDHAAGVRRVLFALADPAGTERFQKLGLVKRTQAGRDLYVESPAKFGVVTEWMAVKDAETLDAITKPSESRGQNLPPAPSGGLRSLMQVALAASDVEAMSQHWAEIIGVPAPQPPAAQVPPAGTASWMFHGQPSSKQLRPIFIRLGDITVEAVGLGGGEGSNNFQEFLNKRGDGVQHFAFSVDDTAGTIQHFEELGIGVGMVPVSRPNAPSSGPVAMMDGVEKLGVDLELFRTRRQ